METKVTVAAVIVLFLVFGGATLGVFLTKVEGFGKYTVSVLVLVLALFVASLAFSIGRIEAQPFMSLLFAVVGYAGGLISKKE